MDSIVFLIFRRMRRPLVTLIMVYAVAVLGLVMIPGQDADGNVVHMDFFHAFYFVSFTATTIGFGEIPYDFTDGQRLWVTVMMYVTVISWIYAIGTILALVQNDTFQRAIAHNHFTQYIRRMREPFFIICGYGETGSALVKSLTDRGQHVVVIEINEKRANLIQLDNLQDHVPTLNGDAQKPKHLRSAGLEHAECAGVVAITNVNEANLKIAITSKLLHPHVKVICRADSHDVEDNMASFGTDYIIDPFDTFASYLSLSIHSPCLYLLHNWLSSEEGSRLMDPLTPPVDKHWVVCGYGRFGKAVVARLKEQGIRVVVVEASPESTGTPEEGCVAGRGTEANSS